MKIEAPVLGSHTRLVRISERANKAIEETDYKRNFPTFRRAS